MFRWFLALVCILAVLAGLTFGVMNPDPVIIRLPGLTFELALGALLMLALAIGILIGLMLFMILFALPAGFRRKARRSPERGRGMANTDA